MATKKGSSKKNTKRNVNRTLPIQDAPKPNLKFTYFAACGNYPEKGFEYLPNVWWSANHFGQQLWKEIDNSNRQYSQLGPAYNGTIPLEVMLQMVAEDMFGGADFQKVYKNWTFKYQVGTSRYVNGRYEERQVTKEQRDGSVKEYTVREYKADLETTVKKTVEKSKGNPPIIGFTKEEREAYRARNQ